MSEVKVDVQETVTSKDVTSLSPVDTDEGNYIPFEHFAKVELKVGTIISAERVPKKDRLLLLRVDFAETSPRQVVAGIGATFAPESLVGGQYMFVTNLTPRQVLKDLWSYGMILATGPSNALSLVRPEKSVPNGACFA